ncbi:hypothetical protein [Prosthecochloris sp. SCSIO W1103]|uniref:hypothetical protein n=1 Tax=Prosthecochloris sp. SCSIO W1103 TaxID=2992244 RepID=UPI00223DFDBD|nr:hypothetical protein [Prosthecochloris sp. SCSIO W1103]UZJ37247.1 hypothetical protein OO005_10905 [Prosthecochloris sp. SCSIO W1103]
MGKSVKLLLFIASIVVVFPLQSCVVSRPAEPGSDFVWVAPYTLPRGVLIPGHWKYVGPPRHRMVWIPGHYNHRGDWVTGRWKKLKPPKDGAYWVPGHRSPTGRWTPGYWRYR